MYIVKVKIIETFEECGNSVDYDMDNMYKTFDTYEEAINHINKEYNAYKVMHTDSLLAGYPFDKSDNSAAIYSQEFNNDISTKTIWYIEKNIKEEAINLLIEDIIKNKHYYSDVELKKKLDKLVNISKNDC